MFSIYKAKHLLLTLAFSIYASCTLAQPESQNTELDEEQKKQAVTLAKMQITAQRTEQAVINTPVPVNVIPGPGTTGETPAVFADLLRGQPGIFVQQTTPGQGIPIVRGLKGSQVLHMVDGFRLNNAFFRNAPNQYLALLDPQWLDSIEVVRGPASTQYGSDALGGVVHFRTIQPRTGNSQEHRDLLRFRYNTGNRGWLGHIRLSGSHKNTAFQGSFGYQDEGDRRTGSDQRISPSGFQAKSFNLSLTGSAGDGVDWLLNTQFLQQPRTPRVDELVPGFGQSESNSELFFFQPNDRLFIHNRWRFTQGLAWADYAEFHLGMQEINDDRETQNRGSEEIRTEQNRSRLWGLTSQFSNYFNNHHLIYGFDIYYDKVRSQRIRRNITSNEKQNIRPRFSNGATQNQAGLFLQDQWYIHPKLTLSTGSRLTYASIDLPASVFSPASRVSDLDITWQAGINYELTENTRLVANAGRAFRSPNIFDLSTLGERPGNRFNIPNSQLSPEKLLSIDLGFKHLSSYWSWEAFIFAADYSNQISSVLTGEVTEDGRDVVQNQNINQLKTYGFETGFNYQWHPAWLLWGSLTYTRGNEKSGDGLEQPGDRIPPLNGNLGISFKPSSNLRFSAEFLSALNQDRLSDRDINDPRINPLGTPGWGTINLSVDWHVMEQLRVGLNFDNIFDKQYREHGSGIDASGRSIRLTLDTQF